MGTSRCCEDGPGARRPPPRSGGAEAELSGSVDDAEQKGTTITLGSPSEFVAYAPHCPAFQFNASRYSPDSRRISFGRHDFEGDPVLRVSLPLDNKASALEAIARFVQASGLTEANDGSDDEPENSTTIHRRYRTGDVPFLTLLSHFSAHLAPAANSPNWEASVRTAGPEEREMRFSKLDELRANLPDNLAEVRVWPSRRRRGGTVAELAYDRRRNPEARVDFSVPRGREAIAEAAVKAFENAAGLQPVGAQQEAALQGLTVTCFARAPLSEQWLDTLSQTLTKEIAFPRWSSGELELRDQPKRTFRDATLVFAEAKANWQQALVIQISVYGEDTNISATVEPRLDLVKLTVETLTESTSRNLVLKLETTLGLQEHPRRPYDSPRVSRSYRFRTFQQKKLADTLGTLIADFIGEDPIVWKRDTYIAEIDKDGNRSYTRYSRLAPFIERLAADHVFVEAQIAAVGPHDKLLVFQVWGQSRFEVRSSFDNGTQQDLLRELNKRLKLEPDDAPDKDSGDQPKSAWQQIRNLEGLYGKAVVGAVAVVMGLVGFAADRWTSKDTIALISPSPGEKNMATVLSGCVPVEWEVRTRSLFDDGKTTIREQGRLQVDSADGRRIAALEGFRSGDGLFLPAGDWTLYVYDELRQRRSPTLAVTAKANTQESANLDPAPADPKPCRVGR